MPPSIRLSLALLIPLAACSDPTLEPPEVETPLLAPTLQAVAGSYHATTFTTREGGVTTNQLTRGSLLDLVLKADSTTAGRLFVPGGDEDGGDFDADLRGTWTLSGVAVAFQHSADTFVRDMPFVYNSDKLIGERTFGTVTVRVVLAKQ